MINMRATENKIKVMQAYIEGKELQYSANGVDWLDINNIRPLWDWHDTSYRIKPETVEGAAKAYVESEVSMVPTIDAYKAFLDGAEWQKDSGNV